MEGFLKMLPGSPDIPKMNEEDFLFQLRNDLKQVFTHQPVTGLTERDAEKVGGNRIDRFSNILVGGHDPRGVSKRADRWIIRMKREADAILFRIWKQAFQKMPVVLPELLFCQNGGIFMKLVQVKAGDTCISTFRNGSAGAGPSNAGHEVKA